MDNKIIKNKNIINLEEDEYFNKVKKLIGYNNPTAKGSYLKYGKEKACDLDMYENIDYNKEELTNYFKKIKNNKEFILLDISIDIKDDRVTNMINELGPLSGLFNIQNKYPNLTINNSLPSKIKNKVNKLNNNYLEEMNIENYKLLYKYLKSVEKYNWSIDEIIKGYKNINGNKILLEDLDFSYIYFEIIYENFRTSNMLIFKNESNLHSNGCNFNLNSALQYNCINYYRLIKNIQVFLKWAYFNKIFKERELINNVSNVLNRINSYRDEMGDKNYKLCILENKILVSNSKKDKSEYEKEYCKFNMECKDFFKSIIKDYSIYIDKYIIYS